MTTTKPDTGWIETHWCVLRMLGHRTLAGLLDEVNEQRVVIRIPEHPIPGRWVSDSVGYGSDPADKRLTWRPACVRPGQVRAIPWGAIYEIESCPEAVARDVSGMSDDCRPSGWNEPEPVAVRTFALGSITLVHHGVLTRSGEPTSFQVPVLREAAVLPTNDGRPIVIAQASGGRWLIHMHGPGPMEPDVAALEWTSEPGNAVYPHVQTLEQRIAAMLVKHFPDLDRDMVSSVAARAAGAPGDDEIQGPARVVYGHRPSDDIPF